MTTWNENLSVGNDHIDDHHQELFALTSMIDAAVKSNRREEINKIIQYLETYTLEHFDEEEAHMKTISYSDIDYHQREHEIFRIRVIELRKYFDSNTPNTHLVFQLRKFVDRLMLHIITVDSGMKEDRDTH